jgi:hypothetical protein
LSTKGRYAVVAMIDLALRDHAGPVALSSISARVPSTTRSPAVPVWLAPWIRVFHLGPCTQP